MGGGAEEGGGGGDACISWESVLGVCRGRALGDDGE